MSGNTVLWTLSYRRMREAQEPLLRDQLRYVASHSRFFCELWRRHGFDNMIPKPDEFERLPFVTKQSLREALQEGWLGSHLACDPSHVSHIYASSGTSGYPTYFGLTTRDLAAWLDIFIRGFKLGGARPGDRVLHAFGMSRSYAGAVPMVRAFETMGVLVLPLGAEAGSARLCDAIRRLRPTLVYASPSMLRRLAHAYAEEFDEPLSRASVERIITGGEPGAGDSASKQELSDVWGAQVREAGGGSDICPLMWAECDAQDGLHFVAGDEVLFELIDPLRGTVLEPEDGIEGEIVYTHLKREANPLVRMRHGDIVELQVSRCSCGSEMPRIRFRGRVDDMVIARGVKVFPSSVQAVVSEFVPALTGIFAISRPPSGVVNGPLRILCEQSAQVESGEGLREQFEVRARQVLGVRVACELVREGSLGQEGEQKGVWIVRGRVGSGP